MRPKIKITAENAPQSAEELLLGMREEMSEIMQRLLKIESDTTEIKAQQKTTETKSTV